MKPIFLNKLTSVIHKHINPVVLSSLLLVAAISAGIPKTVKSEQNRMGGKNPTIAHVENMPVTIQDVEDKQINDLRVELHKRLQRKLQLVTLKKLAGKYPEYKLEFQPTVTDKFITDFFYKNNLQSRGSLEELKPRIKALLQMKAISEHYDRLYQQAVTKGLIVTYLQEPNEFLVRVPIESAFLWGGKRETVMVLEFSDYQCPFCSRVQETVKQLRKTYRNKVAFGYRHSPLAFHKEADEAAIAVECARDQGKFKQYHEILFNNYRNISTMDFDRFAKEAGISNMKLFKSCLAKEEYRSRVENDQKAATEAGIRGTPGFVIGKYNRQSGIVNGEIISGAQPLEAFTEIIDKYLSK